MKTLARWLLVSVAVLFTSAAIAQPAEPYPRRAFSQAELDQMLAPIALYPDSLLSQILMAATYPRDVYEAASWSRVRTELRGESAVRAAEEEPWDPSVVSLTAFPQVLAMMDERREWTERLGEAFIEQPEQVMETVQALRAKADAAGNLRTTEEMVVQRQGDYYVIEPPTPEVVYVPYYDPRYVYGTWWWPSYQPVYWRPWRGYAYYPRRSLWAWGYPYSVGPTFFFGHFDWHYRHLRYSSHRPWYWRNHHREYHRGDRWRHDRDHRWRDRDRDGRPDWRDRDGRWRDRDRDGRRDDRDGRRDDRDGRGRDRDRDGRRDRPAAAPGTTAAPAVTSKPQVAPSQPQGFFPTPANPVARPATPRYPVDAVPSTRPQVEPGYAPSAPGNALSRPAYTPRPVPQQAYPAPVPHAAPAPAPTPRAAPAPAAGTGIAPPVRPQAPAAAAPAPRSAPPPPPPSEPASSESPAPSNPMSRGGGRGVSR